MEWLGFRIQLCNGRVSFQPSGVNSDVEPHWLWHLKENLADALLGVNPSEQAYCSILGMTNGLGPAYEDCDHRMVYRAAELAAAEFAFEEIPGFYAFKAHWYTASVLGVDIGKSTGSELFIRQMTACTPM